jgi:Leucine-rich repeat (LRR) protein
MHLISPTPRGLLSSGHDRLKMAATLALLLSLVITAKSAQLCPSRCTICDPPSVHCERADIDTVPITLNPILKQLHLSHNQIHKLQMHLLDVYQKMDTFDLAHNRIQLLDEQVFKGLTHLKVISLFYSLHFHRLVRSSAPFCVFTLLRFLICVI